MLSTLLKAGAPVKKIIVAGNRLLSMTYAGVQIKDANLYCHVNRYKMLIDVIFAFIVQGSLASLPKSFGFDGIVKKGSFPHLLANTLTLEEMKNYESPTHPPLEM